MERPSLRFRGPVLDCSDGDELAAFYERLLGWPVTQSGPKGWALLEAPEGALKIEIAPNPVYERPVWPSVAGEPQMSIHLDLACDDLEAAVAWAVDCGAEVAGFQPQERVRVLLDPAGHPFCLFRAGG